jgi:hypothetical protein
MLFFVFPPYEYNLFFPDIIKREEFKKGMFMLPAIILIVILLLMLLCFTWVSMAKTDGEQEISDQEQLKYIEEYNKKKK